MDRDASLRAIIERCAELGHVMGDWEVADIDGFDYLRSTCTRDHATALAELDGRLVPHSTAVTGHCLAST